MLFWVIIGIALGYFFHPQIDRGVARVIRMIRDNRRGY
jgi:hypothetical protein